MASVFLVVALLVGGAHPAHAASTTLSATCDSWSVSLLDYDADYPNKVMIEIDDIIVVDDAGFSAGFIVGGEWPGFKATHPPTTTTTRASTTTTTRVPAADAQKTAELPVSTTTTTTALASSPTSSPATTTTLASTKTTDTNTNEVEPTDITVVAASDLGPTSGSTVTPVLIGLVLGAAFTGAIGGAWYLGRRSAP